MTAQRLLVANRGEIAIRICRAAATLGIGTVAVFSSDDAAERHVTRAGSAALLPGAGPAAYLDVAAVVRAAVDSGCTLLHPGYGLLSESPALAAACAAAGITFVGPSVAALELLGDKVACRELALRVGVPVLAGSGVVSADQALAWAAGRAVMVKAVAGGGGRGLRVVPAGGDVAAAVRDCASEARRSFGDDRVFVERHLAGARHVEVQVVGDGTDVVVLGDRDCSLQRRNQKLLEVAPAPDLACRAALHEAARTLARAADLVSLATVEFLVAGEEFFLLEVNPRLQVEHTVTEETTGLDLVALQLSLALGGSLPAAPTSHGVAIQGRVNAEVLHADGSVTPAAGTVTTFEAPTGPGVRVDTAAHAGWAMNPRFDSLVAKVVVHAADLGAALRLAVSALDETVVAGVATTAGVLAQVVAHPDLATWSVSTTWLGEHLPELVTDVVEQADPSVVAPTMRATLVQVLVAEGDLVQPGQELAVVEAMKMQQALTSVTSARVRRVLARVGDVLDAGAPVVVLDPTEGGVAQGASLRPDPSFVRADLAALQEKLAPTLDENRPAAVAKRTRLGRRTARANVAALVDGGSFLEYGQLQVAGQSRYRTPEDLSVNTPADGLVGGLGQVAGSEAVVLAYDYTVLAGTQGMANHKKTDRLLELALERDLPVVLLAEGGGGRPGDVDWLDISFSALDLDTFMSLATLTTPRITVADGWCFAGNALLFGCGDIRIATRAASIGMAGPVMIEAGGLGACRPEDVGPAALHASLGQVEVLVDSDVEAVEVARRLLPYLTGARAEAWEVEDQRLLRHVVPEDRKRAYPIREVAELLTDAGSLVELRAEHCPGLLTALATVEGYPCGVLGNDPLHLGGAVDAAAADKAAWFFAFCERFALPLVVLCDTPGFMVGPPAEAEGTMGAAARMMAAGGALTVPLVLVCTRKGYGLGAMAMAGGSFTKPVATLTWPSGELGAMGLEGATRIVFGKEVDAVADPVERAALFEQRVAQVYERGQGTAVARILEVDAVIDPAETRAWVVRALGLRRQG